MGGAVEPSVAAKIEPAVNLARRVVSFGKLQQLLHIGELAELLRRRIVFVHKRISRREVVAHGSVVFSVRREAVAPCRPRFPRIILPRKKREIHDRRSFRDGHIGRKTSGRFQKIRRTFRDARRTVRKPRRECDISRFVRTKARNRECEQRRGVKKKISHGCSTVRT